MAQSRTDASLLGGRRLIRTERGGGNDYLPDGFPIERRERGRGRDDEGKRLLIEYRGRDNE